MMLQSRRVNTSKFKIFALSVEKYIDIEGALKPVTKVSGSGAGVGSADGHL